MTEDQGIIECGCLNDPEVLEKPVFMLAEDLPDEIPSAEREDDGTFIETIGYDKGAQDVIEALAYVADFMAERDKHVEMVAVGGIDIKEEGGYRRYYLMHPPDFLFHSQHSGISVMDIYDAFDYGEEESCVELGEIWPGRDRLGHEDEEKEELRDELFLKAGDQEIVLFQKPGLSLFAAPWSYALTTKLDCLARGIEYDRPLEGAVFYLHEHIIRKNDRPVPMAKLKQWGTKYDHQLPDRVLMELRNAYQEHYHRCGVCICNWQGEEEEAEKEEEEEEAAEKVKTAEEKEAEKGEAAVEEAKTAEEEEAVETVETAEERNGTAPPHQSDKRKGPDEDEESSKRRCPGPVELFGEWYAETNDSLSMADAW